MKDKIKPNYKPVSMFYQVCISTHHRCVRNHSTSYRKLEVNESINFYWHSAKSQSKASQRVLDSEKMKDLNDAEQASKVKIQNEEHCQAKAKGGTAGCSG